MANYLSRVTNKGLVSQNWIHRKQVLGVEKGGNPQVTSILRGTTNLHKIVGVKFIFKSPLFSKAPSIGMLLFNRIQNNWYYLSSWVYGIALDFHLCLFYGKCSAKIFPRIVSASSLPSLNPGRKRCQKAKCFCLF
jgi:hypothetical protein